MEKISELIKEAKPLYKERKRNRMICKLSLSCFIPVFAWMFAFNTFAVDTIALNTSPIEDMGLPTDEYGLLLVE